MSEKELTKLIISIHALLWSATFNEWFRRLMLADFYPRTPVECDYHGHIYRL